MDKELLKAILAEIFPAALEYADGKKFLTLAIRLTQSILLKDIVLDRIINALFGTGVNLATMATALKDSGVTLPTLAASSGPDLTADEMEAALKEVSSNG